MLTSKKTDDRLGASAPRKEYREIKLAAGRAEGGSLFPNNYITTGKYTVFTLIPKNLFEQFHRIANIWFLIVSILQVLPLNLSPTSSWATIAPLSLVLTITLIKDAYLDYRRHRSDREINNRKAQIWNDTLYDFTPVLWQHLEVGNFIKLTRDEPVPVDLLILTTSGNGGVCYIETANLDGESNLKIKSGLADTMDLLGSGTLTDVVENIPKLDESLLKTEHPNNRLYTFEGSLKVKGHPKATPVDSTNVILRGSQLKNTQWLLGVVIFTGPETKLMMNSKTPPHKRSNVERRVNRYLTIVFTVLFTAAILSTVISIINAFSEEKLAEQNDPNAKRTSFLNFFTFMILYNGLVPISLYVTMDLVRVLQTRFIQWDLRMYSPSDDRPAIAKTGDLNEDLGQIEFVFSDKTGTLTENMMEFRRCSVAGRKYGVMTPAVPGEPPSGLSAHPKFKFRDPSLIQELKQNPHGKLSEFTELLCLCHTVLPELDPSGHLCYQGASPDEEALVIAAHCFGYSFDTVKTGILGVTILGEKREYRVLGVNEFTSSRKRMSVVVQTPTGGYVLYCKGADNVILELCNATSDEVTALNDHLREFAVDGLRTLVCAKRILTQEQASDFEKKYVNAKNAMSDRSRRLQEVAEEYELELEILGATAIEDKIQDGVPETIDSLMKAGVKVWVLTGDKQETAINIGYACKLLSSDVTVLKLNVRTVEEAQSNLRYLLMEHVFKTSPTIDSVRAPSRQPNNTPTQTTVPSRYNHPFFHRTIEFDSEKVLDVDNIHISLVVDGTSLTCIMDNAKAVKMFSMLSFMCHSVICCRVSPIQKSDIVKLVKQGYKFKPMTLAIGDGANDVSMIQEAHVGIGISGKEGLQAVNSSDYAIARFRFLLPLLVIHGRWNYHRITTVILYSFYKNFLLILPMFYYSFVNQYSGTALYDSYLIMSYNVALTSIPIVVLGVMDKDLDADSILTHPGLYTEGILAKRFNSLIFLKWVFLAISESLVIFGLVVMLSGDFANREGRPEDLTLTGTVAFYAVVETVSYVIAAEMRDWTAIFVIILLGSFLLFYPFVFIYDMLGLPTANMMGVFTKLFSYPPMCASMLLTPLICLGVHLTISYMVQLFAPTEVQKMQKRDMRVHPEAEYSSHKILNFRPKEFAKHLSHIFTPAGLKREVNVDKDDFSMGSWTLEFLNPHLEKTFKRYLVDRSIKFIRRMFWLFYLFVIIWYAFDLSTGDRTTIKIIQRVVIIIVLFPVVLLTRTRWFVRHYELCVMTIVGIGIFIKLINDILSSSDGSMSTALLPILAFILFNLSTYKVFIMLTVAMGMYLIRVSVYYSGEMDGLEVMIIVFDYSSLLIGNFLVSAFVGYVLEKEKRHEFVLKKQMEAEFQKGQDILGNLLPKFVRDRVKMGVRYIAEDQGLVTIMLCDIYGFDKITITHSPKELTDLLDGFFAEMDHLCEEHGVTKIETVNKTYLACGGLKDSEEQLPPEMKEKSHAERILTLALHVLKRLELVSLRDGTKFQVKIGINTGPILAGVVGEHKPQFSLIGDTINTASRMCSTLKMPDHVQISSATYELVKDMDVTFQPSTAEAKGKGLLTTYLVFAKNALPSGRRRTSLLGALPVPSPHGDQPNVSLDINDSSLPLISKKNSSYRSNRDSFQRSQTTKNTFDDTREIAREDIEDLELAGPVQWVNCIISESPELQQYRLTCLHRDKKSMKYGGWMTFGILVLVNLSYVVAYAVKGSSHGSPLVVVFRLGGLMGVFAEMMFMKKIRKQFGFPWLVTLLYAFISFISAISLYTVTSSFLYTVVLEVMYCNVVINHISGLTFGYILVFALISFSSWILIAQTELGDFEKAIEATFFVLIFSALNMAASYVRESQDRRTYNLNKLAEREILNTENLLKQMMPPHVVRNLKNGIAPYDKYRDVTILYSDIVGFTAWSSTRKPIEVVTMLNKLFTTFDHLCVKNHVYKVHTIGDCYVVLGFADTAQGDKRDPVEECHNMVRMAFDMVKAVKKVNKDKKMNLSMRIGLHTGEIIAGITGTNIVRYDIYGADNDIANKMESNGASGRVNVSEVTKTLLESKEPGRYEFVFNKEVRHDPVNRTLESFFVNAVRVEDMV